MGRCRNGHTRNRGHGLLLDVDAEINGCVGADLSAIDSPPLRAGRHPIADRVRSCEIPLRLGRPSP